jgi:hypothetical protein
MFIFAPFSPDTGQGGEVHQPEELFVPFTGTVDLVQSLTKITGDYLYDENNYSAIAIETIDIIRQSGFFVYLLKYFTLDQLETIIDRSYEGFLERGSYRSQGKTYHTVNIQQHGLSQEPIHVPVINSTTCNDSCETFTDSMPQNIDCYNGVQSGELRHFNCAQRMSINLLYNALDALVTSSVLCLTEVPIDCISLYIIATDTLGEIFFMCFLRICLDYICLPEATTITYYGNLTDGCANNSVSTIIMVIGNTSVPLVSGIQLSNIEEMVIECRTSKHILSLYGTTCVEDLLYINNMALIGWHENIRRVTIKRMGDYVKTIRRRTLPTKYCSKPLNDAQLGKRPAAERKKDNSGTEPAYRKRRYDQDICTLSHSGLSFNAFLEPARASIPYLPVVDSDHIQQLRLSERCRETPIIWMNMYYQGIITRFAVCIVHLHTDSAQIRLEAIINAIDIYDHCIIIGDYNCMPDVTNFANWHLTTQHLGNTTPGDQIDHILIKTPTIPQSEPIFESQIQNIFKRRMININANTTNMRYSSALPLPETEYPVMIDTCYSSDHMLVGIKMLAYVGT